MVPFFAKGSVVHAFDVLFAQQDVPFYAELEHLDLQDLAAKLGPVLDLAHASLEDGLHQLVGRDALAGREVIDRAIDFRARDGDLRVLGRLDLKLLVDHLIDELP